MASDQQVALTFSHNYPRYEAIGVDPNDLRALQAQIKEWKDWCRIWSEAGGRHEALAKEAYARVFASPRPRHSFAPRFTIMLESTCSLTLLKSFAQPMTVCCGAIPLAPQP